MGLNRIKLNQTMFGQTMQNVLHFYIDGQVTADLPALLVNLRDHWLDIHRNWQSDQVTHVGIDGQCLSGPDVGQMATLPVGTTGTSSSGANSLLQLALVIQLRTGLAGRKERGRIFIGGKHPNEMNSGNWNTADMAASITKCATLLDRWCVTPLYGAALVIHGPDDDPSVFRFVNSMTPRAAIGTQRRRGVGVGS